MPPTLITAVEVSNTEPYTVAFAIGNEQFRWQEKLDWIERGGILAQPVLEQVQGSEQTLLPTDYADRELLAAHLRDAITALATALRDARLNDTPAPEMATLRDLLPPCPVCGGWMDFNGHCNACASRKVREQQLFHERQHLMSERAAEAEERHRLAERLPLARRRLDDLEREIAQAES